MKQNLLRHGRDWNQIAEALQTKTSIQAKNYYFNNQKEMAVFVRAWEKEQVKGEGSAKGSETSANASASASPASATKKEEPKRTTGPVTIQPAPGQSSANTNAGLTSAPGSGRGNAHYPNVIPQGYVVKIPDAWFVKPGDPIPLLPPSAILGPKAPRDKALVQQPTVPTPPLPLPGPTFRAWPVTAAPPPQPMSYAFGTFSGVGGPSVVKSGAVPSPSPNAPRPNTNAKAGTSGSAPKVIPAGVAPRAGAVPGPSAGTAAAAGAGGVQRGNPNHYPGPMRYQPYPVTATSANAGGVGKGKAPVSHLAPQKSTTSPAVKPAGAAGSGVVTGGSPKGSLPRTSSGQFAAWNGEGKGKKQA